MDSVWLVTDSLDFQFTKNTDDASTWSPGEWPHSTTSYPVPIQRAAAMLTGWSLKFLDDDGHATDDHNISEIGLGVEGHLQQGEVAVTATANMTDWNDDQWRHRSFVVL